MTNKQIIRFFTFCQYHGKSDAGSTRIRALNLIKYWDEAELYQYGEKPDVMIYQKVYTTYDYKFQKHFKGIQILDVCDPDWKDSPDIFIKETLESMDAVVVPTQAMHDFLKQLTDKPIKIIKDRFDMNEFPKPKVHKEEAKIVVWYGYAHNAESIRFAIPSLENRGLRLLVVSNEDPACYRWATDSEAFKSKYTYKKFNHPQAYNEIQKADVCIMMPGHRPLDIFKSENKTVQAELLGVPVVTNAEQLDSLINAEARNEHVEQNYAKLKAEYDVHKSISEYKELIKELSENTVSQNGK